jgi:hypothetical protein
MGEENLPKKPCRTWVKDVRRVPNAETNSYEGLESSGEGSSKWAFQVAH